ncbi:hypothetical protein [Pannonibacter carbonis]|uniref:hypothetical protein n=1 Tax=Pannonibacter carbonis TaxID=2067569 RepID=UPI001300BA3C|nr:hypothetical protein [Pannonibacter carbonis]
MRTIGRQSKTQAVNFGTPFEVRPVSSAQFPMRENTLLLSGVALIVVSASMMLSTLIG